MDLHQDRYDFKLAVEKRRAFRKKANLCYRFYFGDQWEGADTDKLKEEGRPFITINRIRPRINLLSGFQRLNRYEPEFLPRTANDLELCKLRKATTKFIFDQNEYDEVESRVAMDGYICGEGWAQVDLKPDYETLDTEARIIRRSPFDIYPDPECKEVDLSDAEYIFDAFWTGKERLKLTFPEKKDDIDAYITYYDQDEDNLSETTEPLYYSNQTKKVRLITKYYKKWSNRKVETGETDPITFMPKTVSLPVCEIWFVTFIGNVELERKKYPFEHGMFPFARYVGYYTGEGDTPDGVVADLIDLQREENKTRSQILHNINTMANSNYLANRASISPEQEKKLAKTGNKPGAVNIVNDINGVKRNDPPPFNQGLVQHTQMLTDDYANVSNINEAAMGTDIPNQSSGKAIELKQRAANTGTNILNDNLRNFKKDILYRLWGKCGKKGIVQQYYTEPKLIRITQDDGQMGFVAINQPMPMQDPVTGAIQTTMIDLSVGEYDIVISDTPATATMRQSQFLSFMEMMKLMPPQAMPFFVDILVDLSDNPNKEQIKQRVNELKPLFMPQPQMQPMPEGEPMTQPAMQSLVQNNAPVV